MNFNEWKESRNDSITEVPEDTFQSTEASVLCKWLSLYVAETRKKDGSRYPPKTIYLLLSGLLRHMRTHNPAWLLDLVWWKQQTTAYQKKNWIHSMNLDFYFFCIIDQIFPSPLEIFPFLLEIFPSLLEILLCGCWEGFG